MSDIKTIKVKILQEDCEAYGVYETKNGAEIEVAPELAERMSLSGHALIVTDKKVKTESKDEKK